MLLKHLMGSIPMHLLRVLKKPRSVLHKLNQISTDFLWDSKDSKRKNKWVAWDKVYRPTEEDGLGIRKIEDMEKTLHMKFV